MLTVTLLDRVYHNSVLTKSVNETVCLCYWIVHYYSVFFILREPELILTHLRLRPILNPDLRFLEKLQIFIQNLQKCYAAIYTVHSNKNPKWLPVLNGLKKGFNFQFDVLFVLCNTYRTLCTVNYYIVACCAEKLDLDVELDLQLLNTVCK